MEHEHYEEQNWFSKGSCYMEGKVWKKCKAVVLFGLQNIALSLGQKNLYTYTETIYREMGQKNLYTYREMINQVAIFLVNNLALQWLTYSAGIAERLLCVNSNRSYKQKGHGIQWFL